MTAHSRTRLHLFRTILRKAPTATVRALRPLAQLLAQHAAPDLSRCPFCHQPIQTGHHGVRYRQTPLTVSCDPPSPGQAHVLTLVFNAPTTVH